MVNQAQIDRLTDELEDLRREVMRDGVQMADRVERVLNDARRLHDEAVGTAFEPALQSVENLLGCLQRGIAAQGDLNTKLRRAG
ncbi:MAG: hypothetical protein AAFX76_10515 [Planctomycetota bacterium]